MGYTKHFHEKITLRGNIKYPASEHGGSASVELSEPLDFYVNVDTDPFNDSVDACVGSLHALQASVVATEAVELETKRKNSMRLGKTLSDGFFELVCANVDMQSKEEKAGLESVFQALINQKDDLLKKKQIMESDYHRIKDRYVGIFNDLNKELRNRIFALQEATFRFVARCRKEQERNAENALLTTTLVGHKENTELQSKLCSSNLKQRAAALIQGTKQYIHANNVLKSKIQAMLAPEQKKETKFLPVVFSENTDAQQGKQICIPDNEMLKMLGVYGENLKQEILSRPFEWKTMSTQNRQNLETQLKQEISRNLGTSSHDTRVAALILTFWEQHLPSVLANE